MASKMLDVHSANEEVKARSLYEEVRRVAGDTASPLFDKYVMKPPANRTGTIQERAEHLLNGSGNSSHADSGPGQVTGNDQ